MGDGFDGGYGAARIRSVTIRVSRQIRGPLAGSPGRRCAGLSDRTGGINERGGVIHSARLLFPLCAGGYTSFTVEPEVEAEAVKQLYG